MNVSQQNHKPLFCIDVTSDKHNETVNGSEFITRSASVQKAREYSNKQDGLQETVKKSQLPWWLEIIKALCAFLFLAVLSGMIQAGSFQIAMKNAPILVICGFLGGIAWIVLHFYSKMKKQKVLAEENVEEQIEAMDEDLDVLYKEMEVPEDAKDIDILCFQYTVKDGNLRPHTAILQPTPYTAIELKIYADSDQIHLADVENVYSFKKEEIKEIVCVNKRISIPSWHKDEPPTKGAFKPYKMTVNNGMVYLKPYYILTVERNGHSFGIYFPCYELPSFEQLTGLSATDF